MNPPPRQAVSPARPPPPPPAARPLPAPAPAQTVEELVLSDSDDDAKPSTSAHPASQTEAKPDVDAAPGSAAGRPSPVVAARPAPTMAARKGPLGSISARPVGGKRNKTRLVHPTKRAPTTIDVVTTAKDAAERTQKREARAKQDPPVSNVSVSFPLVFPIDTKLTFEPLSQSSPLLRHHRHRSPLLLDGSLSDPSHTVSPILLSRRPHHSFHRHSRRQLQPPSAHSPRRRIRFRQFLVQLSSSDPTALDYALHQAQRNEGACLCRPRPRHRPLFHQQQSAKLPRLDFVRRVRSGPPSRQQEDDVQTFDEAVDRIRVNGERRSGVDQLGDDAGENEERDVGAVGGREGLH